MMRRHWWSLFLVLMVALGGPACSVVITTGGAPPTATVAPTPLASTPTTAPVASTPTPDSRPATPRVAGSGKREVAALWTAKRAEGWTGGVSTVHIAVEPNTGKELRVGFYEEEVAGSGPMWRAAGWMAVIMSGLLLGVDPTDYRYTYEIGGYADGPSAGGLMTVTTLAAILGHPLKAEATMTGTISPDGTIGRVGGIPHKIDGAAAAKQKLVLIPAGQRRAYDEARKVEVDVIQRGQQQGVEVREVADVYAAYQALTGQPLPRADSGPATRPALSAAAADRTRAKLKDWRARYTDQVKQFEALPARARVEGVKRMMADAAAVVEKAAALERDGLPGAAYQQLLAATLDATVATQTARVLDAYATTDLVAGVTRMRALKPSMKADAALEYLESQRPATLGDVVTLADAYGQLGLALGLTQIGDGVAGREVTRADDALEKLVEGTLIYVMAGHLVQVSRDTLDLGLGTGGAPAPSREAVARLAELFRRANEANLHYFETIVLSQLAQESGWHPDLVKSIFASHELVYLLSLASARAESLLEKHSRQEQAGMYAKLGASLNAYVLSSLLVAKYYSLEVKFDRNGGVAAVKNEAALATMLDLAEGRARDSIGVAMKVGGDPIQPVLTYESASARRDGSAQDKFNALGDYWSAALHGQTLGILSGQVKLVR